MATYKVMATITTTESASEFVTADSEEVAIESVRSLIARDPSLLDWVACDERRIDKDDLQIEVVEEMEYVRAETPEPGLHWWKAHDTGSSVEMVMMDSEGMCSVAFDPLMERVSVQEMLEKGWFFGSVEKMPRPKVIQ